MTTLCYGCMQPMQNEKTCPHCGYSADTRNLPHQLPQGTMLAGQYLVGKVLGQGGFGITYLGLDQKLSRQVAIKEYYPSELVGRETTHGCAVSVTLSQETFLKGRTRFLQEAKILARLQSIPQIARVHSIFEENNTAYIVMEYVQGITLEQYVQEQGGRLKKAETFRILDLLLPALEQVHEAGMVHRDISPDNIMVLPDGSVKLLDFGTARDITPENAQTRSTQAVLKQGYAPAEQYIRKGRIGPWTDIYALCATVYYCLTGTLPAEAPVRLITGEEIPWFSIQGLTKNQAAALTKGTASLVDGRYASVAAMRQDLGKLTGKGGRRKKPWLWAAAFLVAAGLLGGIALLGGKEAPEQAVQLSTEAGSTASRETVPAAEAQTAQPRWEQNILRSDPNDWLWDESKAPSVLGTNIRRNAIVSITFLDTLENVPETYGDVSLNQDGSVLAWIGANLSESLLPYGGYELVIAGEGGVRAPADCTGLFSGYSNLQRVSFNGNFHTDYVTTMENMFFGCKSLQYLDLGSFETSHLTNMQGLFYMCNGLRSVNLGGWNTSLVLNMSNVFTNCYMLSYVDLEGLDTSNVRTMSGMFVGCHSMTGVNVRGMDTSSVRDMAYMFSGCTSLRSLDLSGFDFSKVVNMDEMFISCDIQNLDLGAWNIQRVTQYDKFMDSGKSYKGKQWKTLFENQGTGETPVQTPEVSGSWQDNRLRPDVLNLETTRDPGRAKAFGRIERSKIQSVIFLDTLKDAPQNSWDVSEAKDGSVRAWTVQLSADYHNTYERQYVDLYIAAEGGVSAPECCDTLFYGYTGLKAVFFKHFHTETAKSMANMFSADSNLANLNLSYLDCTNAENAEQEEWFAFVKKQ